MIKDKIFNIFKNSNVKITSESKLIDYIEFCINKNENNRIYNDGRNIVSHHHILPVALFNEFNDLKINIWNGSYLTFYNHYYAHWLLTTAISDYGQLNACLAMHNKDIKLGRINDNDLLSEELITEAMMGRRKLQHEYENKIIECEYGIMTNKEYTNLKVSILKNSLEWKETVGKRSIEKFKLTVSKNIINENGEILKLSKHIANKSAKTMSSVYLDENGNETTIYTKSIQKGLETKSAIFLDENGNETSINKVLGQKISKRLNDIIIDENGNETTRAKLNGKKISITKNTTMIDEDGNEISRAAYINKKAYITRSKIYLDENGNETCIDKEQGKLKTKIYEDSTTYYVIKNAITGEVFSDGMNLRDINKLCGTLFIKDKTNYLGLNKGSKTQFINSGKEFLIGLYVEK